MHDLLLLSKATHYVALYWLLNCLMTYNSTVSNFIVLKTCHSLRCGLLLLTIASFTGSTLKVACIRNGGGGGGGAGFLVDKL